MNINYTSCKVILFAHIVSMDGGGRLKRKPCDSSFAVIYIIIVLF